MCGGRRDENGPFDFTINAAWDYCGPSTVYHDENSGEIVLSFTVLGDIDAITNDDGLLMSRALSFQAECAFKDHLEVSETFTADLGGMMRRTQSGAVRKGDQSFVNLFSLNFYEDEEFTTALDQPQGIIGKIEISLNTVIKQIYRTSGVCTSKRAAIAFLRRLSNQQMHRERARRQLRGSILRSRPGILCFRFCRRSNSQQR